MIHLHWHRRVEHPYGRMHYGSYRECRCGKRWAYPASGGHQPVDRGWVETGQWTSRHRRKRQSNQ